MSGMPTHVVMVKRKDGSSPASKVGSAWRDERGWFNIRLDPCVTLTDRDDIYINIYPNRDWKGQDEDEDGDERKPPQKNLPF